MTPLLFTLEPHLPLLMPLARGLRADIGTLNRRRFPDGESYLKVDTPVSGRHCVLLANLVDPDSKFLPLVFVAATLKEMAAASVGLVAPYLSYMRQDTRFSDGEVVTSKIFARLVSVELDWLVTVDPHLHRYRSLEEIYSVPTHSVAGAPMLAQWLAQRNEELLLVGPDIESEQWVSAIAEQIQQPFIIGRKKRRGDRDVTVTLPDMRAHKHRTAVIIDDVVSSGHTLLKTLKALKNADVERIDCATVHGIFADGVDETLRREGVRELISSNSIPHPSNAVDLSPVLVGPIEQQLAACQARASGVIA
ncbi:ribose-phosphate diphosphokinase [Marinimicrobium sp. ABcell2]|uniref:ribose-phosphate diphosphokinase n=1 Tax=Marinimicrobium sp. ABcell2 TaxID=3069751 RepID=UPI0027B33E4E|nr:ribose-phosphate diphosphokinase [Marinimicrobium sp. ABcell2]MDQ2075300.1 ribose-phosphate diphosphokinase [Marinimicrobium sp. ABcell2]